MPELRKNPLSGQWVVLSPERLQQPVYLKPGKYEDSKFQEENPFLWGHEHHTPPEVFALRDQGSSPNQPGWRVRVVPNRFPVLRVEGSLEKEAVGFYDRMSGVGAHEVVIETPDPKLALELQPLSGVVDILTAYRARMLDLSGDERFRYILIFKNSGSLSGATLPHPHSQVIAMPIIPKTIEQKMQSARHYFEEKDRNLFEDILRYETEFGRRMIYENAGFIVFCPYASRFSFETCILPRRQSASFSEISDSDLVLLADALKQTLLTYHRGLSVPSYNFVFHTSPLKRSNADLSPTLDLDFRWHVEIWPRLGGIGGFELGTGFHITPMPPEEAALFLRGLIKDN